MITEENKAYECKMSARLSRDCITKLLFKELKVSIHLPSAKLDGDEISLARTRKLGTMWYPLLEEHVSWYQFVSGVVEETLQLERVLWNNEVRFCGSMPFTICRLAVDREPIYGVMVRLHYNKNV